MTRPELTATIDLAWDAVHHSKAGPLDMGPNDKGERQLGQAAYTVFLNVLQAVLPRHLTSSGSLTMSEPKEPWEG